MKHSQRFFITGSLMELGLVAVAIALNWIFDQPLLSDTRWNGPHALIGTAATLPPLILFFWTLRTHYPPMAGIRQFLENAVRPLFGHWSLWQLLVISLLAGFAEELLFRGALQGGLARLVGALPALILASLIFGCFHPITWAYIWVTSLIGLYLGCFWLLSGNLLTPMITHALYDFTALTYFVRWHKNRSSI